MKAGLIAAGLGERLRAHGITLPKPLVPVAGRPLIDYVLDAVATVGLRQVACIVNEECRGIESHCRNRWPQLAFDFIRRTTPSSMESLFTLRPLLEGERFVLLTVDAVFAPRVLDRFLTTADARADAQAVLALSTFVDDEKPLYACLSTSGRITALGADAQPRGATDVPLVTAGFYLFDPTIFEEIAFARHSGFTALRQFLGHLLRRGYRVYGEQIGKTVDVDRPEDIAIAEAFVRSDFTA
jgi:NDP-sugar pyrophosphorylase family protein